MPETSEPSPDPPSSELAHSDESADPDRAEEELGDEIDDVMPTRSYHELPVVGLGGSAGGLTAMRSFFEKVGSGSGAAYVVILHLSPEHESSAAAILQRSTPMPVMQVTVPVKVEPDHVYVIPPGKHLSMTDGKLSLTEMERARGRRVTVDLFFRTLADTHGPRATAIVLSGADSDGAIGIKRIKERGGLTVAQDPAEAEHDGMPQAAIATGMIDWVLRVEEMPARLAAFRKIEARLKLPPEKEAPISAQQQQEAQDEAALREVLTFLRMRTGHDFSYYKRATVLRRLARRMQVNNTDTLPRYLDYLRTHAGESGALLQDLLISVTNFFRDRETFQALEAHIPALFQGKRPEDEVRVWVAACATGEEAYSVAMLLLEYAGTLEAPPRIQIFASDIDSVSIAFAREAVYPETIAADVSEERLRRFFQKEPRGYRVRRDVRELVLFALHDVLKDAPFSRLDLISCRNLLIYLYRKAQLRAFEIFHFALRPEGRLCLGVSESADDASALFAALDKKHRIYVRRAVRRTSVPVLPGGSRARDHARRVPAMAVGKVESPGWNAAAAVPAAAHIQESLGKPWSEVHFRLIERLGPPSLLIDGNHEILHLSESVSRFLQFSGEPTMSLLRVVHPMLRPELRAALFQAGQTGSPVDLRGIMVDFSGERRAVDVGVRPAHDLALGCLLVVFREREEADTGEKPPGEALAAQGQAAVLQQIEAELDLTKRQLRENIEQSEAQSEEMKASNEELQAMNEELRSAGEELETGREEVQSINEELSTVNQELKLKVDELSRSNSDLQNLMASTNIATIFLDRHLCVQRFTRPALALFNIIETDVGRPLSDLTHHLAYPEITGDAKRVKERLEVAEQEVRHADGRWFLARMLPYRTAENRVDGVVLTFVDITRRRAAETAQREADEWARALIANLPGGAAFVVDRDLRYLLAEGEALALIGKKKEDFVGRTIFEALGAEMAQRFEPYYRRGLAGESFFCEYEDHGRWFLKRGVPLRDQSGEVASVFAASYDIDERKRAERDLRASEERMRLMIENAHDYAIFSLDFDRRITSWNPGAEGLLGFSGKEVMGKPADIIFTPEDRAAGAPEREIAIARAEGRASDDRWHKRKDGSRFFATGAMMAMRNGGGEIVGFLKILRDQTEMREAHDALEQSRAELWEALQENERARDAVEAASRAKDEFLAILSHELRTPLNPVLMATHIMEQGYDEPETKREIIEMIRRNIGSEVQLIDDLLDVTRIGRGKLAISRKPVDVHEAVRRAVEVTDGDVQAKKLRLDVSLDAERHELLGDFTRLQQTVWNLLRNAAKFTPNNGEIHVRTSNEGDRVLIAVGDTGIGIEESEFQRVFNAFAQGSPEVSREYGGLGLGLAIAKAVVEAHGGRIRVESPGRGKGATFTVELPLRTDHADMDNS